MGYPDFEAMREVESARARGYEQGVSEARKGHRPEHRITDALRFEVPAVLVASCPTCGAEVRRSFVDHPFRCPTANRSLTVHMEHAAPDAADGFHEFDVVVELQVELVAIEGCRIEAP
jgi:hypothetical protein